MSQRRSAKACLTCRKRKVRCDVLTAGIPCTNCADSNSCIVRAARNGRIPGQPSKNTLPAENVHSFQLQSPPTGTTLPQTVLQESYITQRTPESLYSGRGSNILSHRPQAYREDRVVLPSYITPLTDIDASVLHFLSSEDALKFPDRGLFAEISHCYLCYFHPMLPFLDLGQLSDTAQGEGDQTLSAALSQAIIFASSAYLTDAQLQALGFTDRSHARRTLFHRVRLLFEMDIESDRMSLVQVLLIMTYWYGEQNDTKGRFHWLRNALSFATDMGLHLSPAEPLVSPQTHMRRRLWYCCVIRATLLSITERRPCAVPEHPIQDVPLRQEDLFDSDAVSRIDEFYQKHYSVKGDTLIELWLIMVRLCFIGSRVVETQYELRGRRRLESGDHLVVLIPKTTQEARLQALDTDRKLTEWQARASTLRELCFDRDHRSNGRILGVHSATLEMVYCVVLSMVHRPILQEEGGKDSALSFLSTYCKQKLRFAARRVTEVGRQMQDGNLVQFLPPVAVGAYIISSTQHLKDVMSADVELKTTTSLFLNQTVDALAAMKGTYNSAACALDFIALVRGGNYPYHGFEWANEAGDTRGGHSRPSTRYLQPEATDSLDDQPAKAGPGPRDSTNQLTLDTGNQTVEPTYSRATPDVAAAFATDFPEMLMIEPFDLRQTGWYESDYFHAT